MSYSWKSFSVIDENSIRTDGNFSTGDSFTYSGADATMYVCDNDGGLAGDSGHGNNEKGSDNQSGWVHQDGEWQEAGNVLLGGYFVLHGDDGQTYYLIEIEGTKLADGGNDHFAFYGKVPPQGVELTATCYYPDNGALSYHCLDGGDIGSHAVAPDADDDFLAVMQGEGFGDTDINVLLNDEANTSEALIVKEIDGSASAVGVWIDLPEGGRVLVAADGTVDFDADGDFDALGAGQTATVSINYTVENSDGLTDTATLSIQVTGVNDAPVAVDQAVRTDEDTEVSGNVLDGAFDVDGDAVSLDGISLGAIGEEIEVTTANGYTGTVVVNADGTFTYTPGPDADDMVDGETDTFTFDFTVKSQNGTTTVDSTRTIDFDGFSTGETITNQIDGVSVRVDAWGKGAKHDEAMIFDSNNPTGGDWDLRTSTQNNVLIISEDSHAHDPDDNGAGGKVYFKFDEPTDVSSLTLIDNEEGAWIGFFDENWNKTGHQWVPGGADNSVNVVSLNGQNVTNMLVHLRGSGAIDDLVLGTTEEVPAYVYDTASVTVTIDGASDGPTISVQNDANTTDEDTAVSGNILTNDSATDGALSVTGIEGGQVGDSFEVTSEGGRTGLLTVNADGSYTFTPNDGFEDLDDGDTDTIVVGYTARAESGSGSAPVTKTIDFEGFNSGEVITNDIDGVTISAWARGRWDNGQDDEAMIFDSYNPTGGDNDLATDDQGNILIISEDNRSSDADDNARGGSLTFEFDAPKTIEQLTWIDIDHRETNTVDFFDADGNLIASIAGITTGDSRQGVQNFDVANVSKMVINLSGSGAVDDVVYTEPGEQATFVEDSATLTITVTGVTDNLPPVVQVETNTTDENTAVSGNLLDDASDPDGDAITIASTTVGALGEGVEVTTDGGRTGTLVVEADGSYTFTPDGVDLDLGQTDTITFGFTATDGQATTSSTATITITGLNEGPVAVAQTATIFEANDQGLGNAASGNLLAGATDADGDTVALESISAGAIGAAIAVTTAAGNAATLTVNADGTFTLTSTDDSLDLGEDDSYSFDFTVVSSGGVTNQFDTQTATVTINGVNVGPVGADVAVSLDEADVAPLTPSEVSGDLLAQATDADGDAVTLQSTTLGMIGDTVNVTTDGGRSGTLEINADGTFTFTSTDSSMDLTQTDTLTFDFTVASTGGTTVQTDTKTATITISGLNEAPVAISQSVTTNEQNDQGLVSEASGNLLTGATDLDGDALMLASTTLGTIGDTVDVITDGGRSGTLTIGTDGAFTFTSTDETLDKGQADTLTFDFTISSTGGAVTQSDTATATININGVNVAPVVVNQTVQIAEANDQGLNSTINGNLLDGAVDADGDSISIFSTSIGAIGETVTVKTANDVDAELTIEADGSFTLTALDSSMDLNESDVVAITFTAVSSGGVTPQFDDAVATININGVNVAPVADDISASIFEQNTSPFVSATTSGSLFANSFDADGDALVLSGTSLGLIGTTVQVLTAKGNTGDLTLNSDGSFTFTSTSSDLDRDEPDELVFDFTVSSSGGTTVQSSTATATINITGVNAPPVAIDQFYSTTESESVSPGSILAGALDVDGDAITLVGLGNGLSISTNSRSPIANTVIVDGETIGELVVGRTGNLSFRPSAEIADRLNEGDSIDYSFTYTVQSNDGVVSQHDTKTVTITINGEGVAPANAPPEAQNTVLTIDETEVATGDLSALVTDPDAGDVISFDEINGVAFNPGEAIAITSSNNNWTGDLTVNADGTFTFDPSDQFLELNVGLTEVVEFTYTASDQDGATDTATVTVNVEGVGTDGDIIADVNYYFLIDASASMFVEVGSLDCDVNGDGETTLIDLSISLAGQLGPELTGLWTSSSPLSSTSNYFTYGSSITEVFDPYTISSQQASTSNLTGALSSLATELDPTKLNQVFVFAGAGASNPGTDDEVANLVNNFNAHVTTYAIGSDPGLSGVLDGLFDLVGLSGDTMVIDDCHDVPEALDEEFFALDEILNGMT